MASYWVKLGERIGYGLAVVVLGPGAALERSARRAMRAALLDFCGELQPLKLIAPKGKVRRSAQLPVVAGSLALEIELDLRSRRVQITVPIERLPTYVEARIAFALPLLYEDRRLRLPTPRAFSGTFCVWTESLADDVAKALVEAVAGSAAPLHAIEITLSAERIEVLAIAPQSSQEWTAIGDRLVRLAASIATLWPASYRGER